MIGFLTLFLFCFAAVALVGFLAALREAHRYERWAREAPLSTNPHVYLGMRDVAYHEARQLLLCFGVVCIAFLISLAVWAFA